LIELVPDSGEQLCVVNVSAAWCEQCVHIFPTVLALAKSMAGVVRFARLSSDLNQETKVLAAQCDITQVTSISSVVLIIIN
jgi:thioredoxin-like negative regulator of GroEL